MKNFDDDLLLSPLHAVCWSGDNRRLYELLLHQKFYDLVNVVSLLFLTHSFNLI
jgi:hypothetical protein